MTHPNDLWTYSIGTFAFARRKKVQIGMILDVYTRECLSVLIEKIISPSILVNALQRSIEVFKQPNRLEGENGSAEIADDIQRWIKKQNLAIDFEWTSEKWRNGYGKSFYSRMLDECLSYYEINSIDEVSHIVKNWVHHYNTQRLHFAIGYKCPYEMRFSNDDS